jgi:hypothetical protein
VAEPAETSDLTPRLAAMLAGAALTMLAVCAVIILWIAPESLHSRPLDLPPAPEPTLQLSPRTDMERFRAQEMADLQSYGPGRIPIDKAMAKVVRDGIPGWPAEAK